MVLLVLWTVLKRRGDTSPEEARKLVADGALLLDVRTEGEFSSGHLPKATNIPLHELGAKLDKLGSKERAIVVYCLSGSRSSAAARVLRGAGFAKVANLGSMSRW